MTSKLLYEKHSEENSQIMFQIRVFNKLKERNHHYIPEFF
jgi:hypothetical protein